jgi:tetratricopeptide (TPR) repeat protein
MGDPLDQSVALARLARRQKYEAIQFYEEKLAQNPLMPRYNLAMGALLADLGDDDRATGYYTTALNCDPQNKNVQNDVALHYSKVKRHKEAEDELRKVMIMNPKHSTSHANLAAIYSRRGKYSEAVDEATQALHLDEDNPQNHRNIARIKEMTGDSRGALLHNFRSIQLEANSATPNTSAYRAAARQSVIQGGSIDEGVNLLRAARRVEGKKYECHTTIRTYEVLQRIARRRGDDLANIANAEKELKEKKANEEAIRNGDISHLLPKKGGKVVQRGPHNPNDLRGFPPNGSSKATKTES